MEDIGFLDEKWRQTVLCATGAFDHQTSKHKGSPHKDAHMYCDDILPNLVIKENFGLHFFDKNIISFCLVWKGQVPWYNIIYMRI